MGSLLSKPSQHYQTLTLDFIDLGLNIYAALEFSDKLDLIRICSKIG